MSILRCRSCGALCAMLMGALLATLLAGCDLPLLGQITGAKPSNPAPPPNAVPLDLSSIATCVRSGSCRDCLTDAQWSPDGARLAILKYCRGARVSDPNNAVLLFDTHTDALLAQVTLKRTIVEDGQFTLVCKNPYGTGNDTEMSIDIHSPDLAWTPDSQRLVVPFGYHYYTPVQAPGTCFHGGQGVLLLSASGQLDQLLLRKDYSSEKFTGWDLQTGEPVESDYPPDALAYRWSADGKLIAVDALSTTGAPPTAFSHTPIGNPIGGATFSIWQPGSIWLDEPTGQPDKWSPAAYELHEWRTSFIVISPDRRYVTWGGAFGWLKPNGSEQSTAQDSSSLGAGDLLRLPMRDAAFQTALLLLPESSGDTFGNRYATADVAWRPDGQLLAMTAPECGGFCARYLSNSVRILRSDTGELVRELTPPSGTAAGELRWSAEGKRLLLVRDKDAIIWDFNGLK